MGGVQGLTANGREVVPPEAGRGGEAFGRKQIAPPCYSKAIVRLTLIAMGGAALLSIFRASNIPFIKNNVSVSEFAREKVA